MKNICEVIKTTDGEECYWLPIEKEIMEKILNDILTLTNWREQILTVDCIPNPIYDLMIWSQSRLRNVFPLCKFENIPYQVPHFVSKVISTNRLIYHKKNNQWKDSFDLAKQKYLFNKEEKEEKEDNDSDEEEIIDEEEGAEDESGFESSCSMSSIDLEYKSTRRKKEKDIVEEEEIKKDESDVLLDSNALLKVRKRKKTDNEYSNQVAAWHPYTVSCVIFSLAVFITDAEFQKGKGPFWSPRKAYFFFKDFLLDQTVLKGQREIPEGVKKMAENILFLFSERQCDITYKIYIEQLLLFFSDAHSMLMKQHKAIITQRNKIQNGSLQPFSIISKEEFKSMTTRDFHPHHSKNNNKREPGVLHCNFNLDERERIILKFERKKVSPIQLYTSMGILERKFSITRKDNITYWNIIFTTDSTILIIEGTLLYDITSHYTLDILVQNSYVIRKLPFPIYYLHLHNYFNGGTFGIISCMKFILKCFCFGRHYEKSNKEDDVMLSTAREEDGSLMGYYKLFNIIIEKFESERNLINYLTIPYNESNIYLWKKKKKTNYPYGIREDMTTIYSAIRSFILVYTKHFILKKHIDQMFQNFIDDVSLQVQHEYLFALLIKMHDISGNTFGEFIEIEQDPEHKFPTFMLFYYFCAHPSVKNQLAITTFLSISVLVKKGKNKSQQASSSSPMSFPYPPLNSELLKDSWRRGGIELSTFNIKKKWKKNEVKTRPIERPHTGLSILLQCLEELSFKKVEERKEYKKMDNYISLPSSIILSNPKEPPQLPIDITKNSNYPIYMNSCLPIWDSLIFESSLLKLESIKKKSFIRSRIFLDDKEGRPFLGCHPDFLECIIIQPITQVDCLPEYDEELTSIENEYLDLRELSSSLSNTSSNSSPLMCPKSSPFPFDEEIEKRINNFRNKIIVSVENNKFTEDPPSYDKISSVI